VDVALDFQFCALWEGAADYLWVHDVGVIGVEEPFILHRRPIGK
jgi:hypothetical protein